jgi:hypothetical protein
MQEMLVTVENILGMLLLPGPSQTLGQPANDFTPTWRKATSQTQPIKAVAFVHTLNTLSHQAHNTPAIVTE